MGNNKSSDLDPADAEKIMNPSSPAPRLSIPSSTTNTNTTPRRIVKAAKLKQDGTTTTTVVTSESDDDDDIDADYEKIEKSSNNKVFIHESTKSPIAARAMIEESIQTQKQERVQNAVSRQRTKRDEKLSKYRKSKDNDKDEKITKQPQPQANPMSRFLSVFSLASHPEHKRVHDNNSNNKESFSDETNTEDEQAAQPKGKRPRTTSENEISTSKDYETGGTSSSSTTISTTKFVVVTTTIIACVATVAFLWTTKRSVRLRK